MRAKEKEKEGQPQSHLVVCSEPRGVVRATGMPTAPASRPALTVWRPRAASVERSRPR